MRYLLRLTLVEWVIIVAIIATLGIGVYRMTHPVEHVEIHEHYYIP